MEKIIGIFSPSPTLQVLQTLFPPVTSEWENSLNVSGSKSRVRIKMKKTVVVQKSGANLHILRLDPKEDIFLGTCQQRFSASLCSPLQLESCYDLQAMESLHFNQKCAYVVAGSSHLLPYLHWALNNQHLYWPWEALTIAKWKACVSGFANKTHIALASAIKYNITVYVCSWECQYKH